jgi:glycosyltransferase involved in cell wall biosynthesis
MVRVIVDTRGRWSGGGTAFLNNVGVLDGKELGGRSRGNCYLLPRNMPVSARMPGTPCVVAPQNALPWNPIWRGAREGLRVSALRIGSEVTGRRADALLRISSAIPTMGRSAPQVSPIIHNVLDPSFEQCINGATALLNYDARGAFVSIGSIGAYRNIDRLITAYTRYRRAGGSRRLLVAGPVPDRRYARELEKRCDPIIGLTLMPISLTRDECIAAFASAFAVVLPSLVEASPLTALEAATVNPRLLLRSIVGHTEMLSLYGTPGTGAWFDPLSTDSMASALLHAESNIAPFQVAHQHLASASHRELLREEWLERVVMWLRSLEIGH